jgi:putative transposase
LNLLLWPLGFWPFIEVLQMKYLNNIIEQDHRFIKKITRPMKGFRLWITVSKLVVRPQRRSRLQGS